MPEPLVSFGRARSSSGQLAALVLMILMFGVSFGVSAIPHADWFFGYQIDKIMHGVAAGALAAVFFPHVSRAWIAVLGAAIIGVGFEIVEAQFTPIAGYGGAVPYTIDTALDIVVDILGALVSARLFFKKLHG